MPSSAQAVGDAGVSTPTAADAIGADLERESTRHSLRCNEVVDWDALDTTIDAALSHHLGLSRCVPLLFALST